MSKNEINSIDQNFLKTVSDVLEQARKQAKTAVNLSMVYAYYEIGRMIVEEEQCGKKRAAYGTQLLKELSLYLTKIYGKGLQNAEICSIIKYIPVLSVRRTAATEQEIETNNHGGLIL